MCGIVGYIGSKDARKIVISGLKQLEYRGYDSAGVALLNHETNKVSIYKEKGRVEDMKKLVDYSYATHYAIGHTRWATHGVPNHDNSHPHESMSGRFILVHNGVIENSKRIKTGILKSYKFKSETDTEVIVNLIDYFAKYMGTEDAIRKAITSLEGSYALIIIDTTDLNKMYVVKNKTPILMGKNKDGITIASDIMVLVGNCDTYVPLEDKTFAIVSNNDYEIFDLIGLKKQIIEKPITIKIEDIDKGNYDHYMLKEIDEQPGIIRNLIQRYYPNEEEILISDEIISNIKTANHIYFVACGTSYHASLIGKYYFEKLVKKPVTVFIASEIIYNEPLVMPNPYFIFISQSGETADSISAMKYCKSQGYKTLAITNSEESSMNRLANNVIDLHAGKEIAVASTKAYVAQVVILNLLTKACTNEKTNLRSNLNKLALAIEDIFYNKDIIEDMANRIKDAKSIFYIGRGLDYYVCLESALKLKEISYIHTEGFPSGELKHGSIALIEDGTPVIAIISQPKTENAVRSNLQETNSRGANTLVISTDSCSLSEDDFIVPNVAHYLRPITMIVVTQLLAYYVSVMKGNDVDKPKNLAKSVTVE